MAEAVPSTRMTLAEKAAPARTALLVVDVQCDYLCAGGITERMGFDYRPLQEILPPLDRFVAAARPLLAALIFTRQTVYPELRSPVVTEHYTRSGLLRPYEPSREDFYQVLPAEGDIVLPKPKYSAFMGTHLDWLLKAKDIRTLVITGVATNVCVESTARDAFMLDYHVIVPRDLVAGVDHAAKEASLRTLGAYFGEVLNSEDLLRVWGVTG